MNHLMHDCEKVARCFRVRHSFGDGGSPRARCGQMRAEAPHYLKPARLAAFLGFLLAFTLAPAAPPALSSSNGLDRDLGHGLAFHRVHQLPGDLPAADSARGKPCVLDLRYVHADADAAAAFAAWLKFNASARAPVFILANADTSAALLASAAPRSPGASVVVIGAAAPGFTPDIAVKISPDAERKAYDALEHGASVESLLAENAGKPRNDEARLAKDRLPDSGSADDSPGAISTPAAEDAAQPPPAPPLLDAALQRAVHLHRALVALRKL
jgi:hypothetical protein